MVSSRLTKRLDDEQVTYGYNNVKLKQLQFRSYLQDIIIFHFQAYYISLLAFRSMLNRRDHGYVATLVSFDPMEGKFVPEGDEVPNGCIEVAYMPNVFHQGGSALGFRLGDNTVEWLCFDRNIDGLILKKLDVDDGSENKLMLFEHVANLPKGISQRRVTGSHPEFKDWYQSLAEARHRPVKPYLTWRNFGTELQKHHALILAANSGAGEAIVDLEHDMEVSTYGTMLDTYVEASERGYERMRSVGYMDEGNNEDENLGNGGVIYEDEDSESGKEMGRPAPARHRCLDTRSSLAPSILADKDTNTLRMQSSSQSVQAARNKEKSD